MLIDWFTVGAQALNFIVLVWLLKRFLYKPILDAIDARETRIAAELADADAKRADAQHERDTFAHKNDAFDQQRAALMTKATQDAATTRQHLIDAAGKAADALTAKRHKALEEQAATLDQAIRHRAQTQVFAIARQALADLATTSLEKSMIDLFVGRVAAMDAGARTDLATAIKATSGPMIVRTAFALPPAQRTAVGKALHAAFATDHALQFDTTPDLVGGIALVAGGHTIGWTISDYLAGMEQRVTNLVQPAAKPAPAPKPTAKPKPKTRTARTKPA
jgi:F-type H+-transporting ATPase subunit b